MTVKIACEDNTAQDLRVAAGNVRDGKVARRLLAIALVLDGASRKTASENCGMDRQTLRDWVHRLSYVFLRLPCEKGAAARHLIYAGQRRQLDRDSLGL